MRRRSRALARLLPVTALLPLGLTGLVHPNTTPAVASAARPLTVSSAAPATQASPAVMRVPASLLHGAAVPVMIELRTPARTLLQHEPQLQSLLSGVRAQLLQALRLDGARDIYSYHLIPDVAATLPGSDLPALLKQPGIASIVLDRQHPLLPLPDREALSSVTTLAPTARRGADTAPGGNGTTGATVNTPQTVEPESYALTHADTVNARGITGAGVRVAIIDSGLDLSQPDLSSVAATDGQGNPVRVDFTGTGFQDTVGHGTACASMIAAQGRVLYSGDNHTLVQVYPAPVVGKTSTVYRSHFTMHGMAPGVRIMTAKIFDTRAPYGGGYDSWIVRAIEWAVDHHANVISESFGGLTVPSDGTDPTATADQAAVRAGVTVVVADGNEGPGQTTIGSPATAPGVIAVGASTDFRNFGQTGFLATYGDTTNDNIASFTSRGPTTDGRARPDVVAPGAFGWGLYPVRGSADGPTTPPYDVGSFGGTSQATPVTAGAAALVIQAFRQAHGGHGPSPAVVRSILMSSAHDLGYPAFDQGAGRVDALEAVQTAAHVGPSFMMAPNAVAIASDTGAPFRTGFTVTNTGSTAQRYAFDAVGSHQTSVRQWNGTINGTHLAVYRFVAAPGMERMVGSVYWNSADRYDVGGSSKEVAMRVSLYDPLGRFVNYSYGVGTGYASAQAAHPMPGLWSLVVTENGRKDNNGVRRYTREGFQARLETYTSVGYGTLSPTAVTLAPGHSARITFTGYTPTDAGAKVLSIHVTGDHTAVLPVVLTSYVTVRNSNGLFRGIFTGASTGYFSLDNENKVYALDVAPGTQSLRVDLRWPNPGYGFLMLLVDPTGEIVDGQFNGIRNTGGATPFDLSVREVEALWTRPAAGRWEIVVMDAVFSGKQRSEEFNGQVRLNDTPVTPASLRRVVLPGSTFDVPLSIRNNNGPSVAEGYIGYAVTDGYSAIPLGTIRGPFGPPSASGTSIYTYTTGFVPPGTRMVSTSFTSVNPNVPIDLAFADPIGFARAQGQGGPVRIDGHIYQGTTATVTGHELPIGQWNGTVTLRRPIDAGAHTGLVGTSVAYARTPLSWVTFDHGLRDGRITGGQPLILLPGQSSALHATITVPLTASPGSYHAYLYVYSVFGDQVASIPLTIVVQPHTGVENE